MNYKDPILQPLPKELFEKVKEDINNTRVNIDIIKECEQFINKLQEDKDQPTK